MNSVAGEEAQSLTLEDRGCLPEASRVIKPRGTGCVIPPFLNIYLPQVFHLVTYNIRTVWTRSPKRGIESYKMPLVDSLNMCKCIKII